MDKGSVPDSLAIDHESRRALRKKVRLSGEFLLGQSFRGLVEDLRKQGTQIIFASA